MDDTEKNREALWEGAGVTVGQLRKELSLYSDDTLVAFGPDTQNYPLKFLRVKKRGEELVQIEFVP